MLSYEFTFRSSRSRAISRAKYTVISAGGIALNALVLATGISLLGMHYLGAQVLATLVVLLAAIFSESRMDVLMVAAQIVAATFPIAPANRQRSANCGTCWTEH